MLKWLRKTIGKILTQEAQINDYSLSKDFDGVLRIRKIKRNTIVKVEHVLLFVLGPKEELLLTLSKPIDESFKPGDTMKFEFKFKLEEYGLEVINE